MPRMNDIHIFGNLLLVDQPLYIKANQNIIGDVSLLLAIILNMNLHSIHTPFRKNLKRLSQIYGHIQRV